MSNSQNPAKIPLPKGWKKHVHSAVLHVLSLAQYAAVYTRGWAADSVNKRVRLKAEVDQLTQEIALLREEIRIKDAEEAVQLTAVDLDDASTAAKPNARNCRLTSPRGTDHGAFVHHRPGVAVPGGHLRQRRQHVQLGQHPRRSLKAFGLRRHLPPQVHEQVVLQFVGPVLGGQDLCLAGL